MTHKTLLKKRALSCAIAAMTTLSGLALTTNDYVYTPNGRYLVIDDVQSQVTFDLNNFTTFTSFSATNGIVATDLFTTGKDEGTGLGYIQALTTKASTEGIKQQLQLTVGKTYVVSFKIKGSSLKATHSTICAHMEDLGLNKIIVYSTNHDDNVISELFSEPQTIDTEWTTFAYSINKVESGKNYYIEFSGLTDDVLIADLEVHEVIEVADLRIRDKYIKLAEAYINGKYIPESALADSGVLENYDELKKIGDESSVTDLLTYTEAMESCLYDINGGLCSTDLDNWLDDNNDNILGPSTTKTQAQTNHGIWTFQEGGVASARLYGENVGSYFEGPHGNGNYSMVSSKGLETTEFQEFPEGSYVFTVELNGSVRESTGKCWDINEGLEAFYGEVYLLNEAGDTVYHSEPQLLPAGANTADSKYALNVLSWNLSEAGKYKVGIIARLRNGITGTGGTITFKDATLYYKSTSLYTKKQINYISDVLEQINSGRTALNNSTDYINSDEYSWGKSELQTVVSAVEPKVAEYEKLDEASIVETYNGAYIKSTDDEVGILVYEIYQEAVKDIEAANSEFLAKNEILNSLATSITDAKVLLANRIFVLSTERNQLKNAIVKAEGVYATLQADDYSESNAQTVKEETSYLSDASSKFRNALPDNAITTVVDIDFENNAVTKDATNDYTQIGGFATIEGKKGIIEIDNFMTTNPLDAGNNKTAQYFPYQKGIDVNGETLYSGYLRVGQGTAVTEFNLGEIGTNIVRVSLDFFLGSLNGRHIGFYLKDEELGNISGIYFSPYDGTFSYNPFNITGWDPEQGKGAIAMKGSDGASFINDNNKTSIQLYLDYGTNKAQLATQLTDGSSYTSEWVDFNGKEAKTFVLESDYNNAEYRRSWVDNLKIDVIQAGELTAVSNVKDINLQTGVVSKSVINGRLVISTVNGIFNVAGARVK